MEGQQQNREPAAEIERDLDVRWITSLIPHRYPFLLVDRVVELERRKRIVAIKNVSMNEEVFQGHFPGHPVYPGVLLVEGMAQAGGILLMREMDPEERQRKLFYFGALERVRFRRPVVPGDQVRYEIKVLRWRASAAGCKLEARALVDGKLAAEARISSIMVDR
jgi:3-hydroxyacyl-[acyl-carrier-protein] dehydratase